MKFLRELPLYIMAVGFGVPFGLCVSFAMQTSSNEQRNFIIFSVIFLGLFFGGAFLYKKVLKDYADG